jgi:DNA-binding MarR family transcriptional regulator
MKPTPTVLNAIKVFEEFRKLDPEMQMQTALIFLLIANNEGCSISDLEKWTGLTSASCSRNVAALSDIHRKGRPGHNMIVARVDANDRRQRNLYLTVKGRSILNHVMERFAPAMEVA